MEGIIKKFFKEKGYGFIKGNDGNEYFFHVDDLKTPDPESGRGVTFIPSDTKKGKRAKSVSINNGAVSKKTAPSNTPSPDRVKCPNCNKLTIPRMIIQNGKPRKSVCHHCGKKVKDFYDDGDYIGMIIFISIFVIFLMALAS